MTKTLYGIKDNKIVIVSIDTSDKEKKQCFKQGCTSVVVADTSQELIGFIFSGETVTMDMFTGVVL